MMVRAAAETKKKLFEECIIWLERYPLNPAYLVIEPHEELSFEVDIQGLFKNIVRRESNVKIDKHDDETTYRYVKSHYLYHGWNPFKIKEYSYRILII